jgi:hypothetical protein
MMFHVTGVRIVFLRMWRQTFELIKSNELYAKIITFEGTKHKYLMPTVSKLLYNQSEPLENFKMSYVSLHLYNEHSARTSPNLSKINNCDYSCL